MRKILLALLICAFTVSAHARINVALFSGSGGSSGCGADYCEDFEGSGAPANWTITADPDYSTAGLNMEGSECVELGEGEYASRIAQTIASEMWFTILIRSTSDPAELDTSFTVRDSSNNRLGYVLYNTDGTITIRAGNSGTETVSIYDLPVNTSTYFKFRYKAGSGANAEFQGWYWNGSAWAGTQTCSDGEDTTNPYWIIPINIDTTDNGLIYTDVYKESTSDINDPTI